MRTYRSIYRNILLWGMVLLFAGTSFAEGNDTTGLKKECSHSFSPMKGMKVEKKGNDTVVVIINKKDMDWNHGCFPPFCHHKNRYNGHWAGVELGWNGYVDKNFNMDFPSDPYMNLNVARSMMVNLNPFELNVNLARNHFGFTTGLGFQLDNYYFTGNDKLIGDSTNLKAYPVYDADGNAIDLKSNKLFVGWITLPLLFEYQTHPWIRWNSFHVSIGVIGGLRIGSYTKQTFDTWNQFYYLQDGSNQMASFYASKKYVREHDPYHLNDFKLDATFRIGWSFLNFFTTYSVTPMFVKNRGPELYSWTIGITLLGW